MSAACITLDQIESRTATSVLLAIYAKRLRDSFVAVTLCWPLLSLLNLRLNQLKIPLKSGALDGLSPEQLNEVATLIKSLNNRLVELTEDQKIRSHIAIKGTVQSIEHSIEDFDSILENIYLALDPAFRTAVSSAIEKLNLGAEESVPVLR
jgi:hypothetical protein